MASTRFPESPGPSWWRPLLVNLLAIASLACLAAYQSRLHHEQQARISADNLAQLLGKHISGVIEKIDLSLHTTVLEAQRQQGRGGIDPASMERFLAQQKSLLPDVTSLHITDAKGIIRHSAGRIPESSISLADRDNFIRLQADPEAGMAVSGPHRGRISKQQWLMVFARRLNRPDGSFAGMVQASISTDRFREMLSSLNVGAHGLVMLRTADTSLVARFPHGENTGEIANRRVSAEYRQSLQANPAHGVYVATSPVDRIERTVAYRQLPGLPLYVGVGLASRDYLAPWQDELVKLAGLVVLFGLIALWLVRSVRRAEKTRQAAQQLLQEAVNSIAIGFSIFDPDDRLVVCNEAARDFLAQSRDMLVPGMQFEDIVRTAVTRGASPEASQKVEQWIRERMRLHRTADGKPFERTLDDGRQLLIIERQTASGHTVTNWIDITELAHYRHHLERLVETRTAELEAASAQFRIFVEQSPAAIAMFGRDLRYIAASDRWIAEHAGGRSDLAGQAMYDMHPDLPEHWKQVHQDALAGKAGKGSEDAWPHGDGSQRWLRWAIHPWIDGAGQVGGIIVATEDFTELKQAEEKLRLVTEHFETALRNSPVTAFSQDREMRFTWVYNPGEGYRAEDFLGKQGTDFLPPGDATIIEAIKKEVMATGQSQRREVRIHFGGGERYYDLTVEPLRNAAGDIDGVSCAVVDLTESKVAETALRRSEERLRMALKAARMFIFEYDPLTDQIRREGEMHPALGIPAACPGSDYFSRFHPDDRAAFSVILENLTPLQPTCTFEYRLQTLDGKSYRWMADHVRGEFDAGKQLARLAGISVDITERKASERKLARHVERQALLLEVASNLLQAGYDRASLARYVFERVSPHLEADICLNFRMNDKDGCLDLVNCFGIPPESQPTVQHLAPGQSICGTVAVRRAPLAFDAERIAADELGAFVRGLGVRAYTCHPLLAKDGNLLGTFAIGSRQREGFAAEELDFLQTIAYFMSLAWERRLAEMEIQRLNAGLERRVEERTAELEASNKELQGFTYAASHDMKGPLGRINSFASLLERNYRQRLEGDGLMFLDLIRRNATRLSTLIDDLLAHAQIDQRIPDIRPVELPVAVREILNEKQDDIREAGAQIWLDLPPEVVAVKASPHGLSQVLRNLLGNALKYSAGANPPVIEIGGRRTGGTCRVWIKDNGIGFDMAYHDRIFEIFRRLHTYEEFPGSGIGLALVKKAMERMGGKVWAESTPGHGATFFLELQAAEEPVANATNYHL